MSIKRFITLAIISISMLLLMLSVNIYQSREIQQEIIKKEQSRFNSLQLARELLQSSDDLTRMARAYAATGDSNYKDYFNRILAIRDGKIPRPFIDSSTYWHLEGIGIISNTYTGETISLLDLMHREGLTAEESSLIQEAKLNSDKLVSIEQQAFKIIDDSVNKNIVPNQSDLNLAQTLLWGKEYIEEKAKIMQPIRQFIETLKERTQKELDSTQNKLSRNLQQEFIIFMLLLLNSAAIIAYTWRFVLRPIQHLTQGTEAIANGDYATRCTVTGSNEISSLSNFFNQMALSIEKVISQHQQTIDQLHTSEARLLEAERQARIGYWEYNLLEKELLWSNQAIHIVELDTENTHPSYEDFLNIIHPDDQSKVSQLYQSSIKNHQPYEINHRLLMPDGRIKWICQRGTTLVDNKSKPNRILVTIQEISKQKEMELFLDYQIHIMNERIKELRCLNQLSDLSRDSDLTLKQFLESAIQLLPPAWSHPDQVSASITYGDLRYQTTEILEETPYTMDVPIVIEGVHHGKIEVSHKAIASNTNPFLTEEYRLLDTFTQQLSQTLDKKIAEDKIKLYASVFERSGEAIAIGNHDGNIIVVNQAFYQLTRLKSKRILGKSYRSLIAKYISPEQQQAIADDLEATGSWRGEIKFHLSKKHTVIAWASIIAIRNQFNEVGNYIITLSDITDYKNAMEHIEHLARCDALTNLPNRFTCIERLQQAINSAQRKKEKIAVMFIDLDRFKLINDTLGHAIGDMLLVEVARRLKSSVRNSDIVARLGGDEFVVVLPEQGTTDTVFRVADKILRNLGQSYQLQNHEIFSSPSIGIAFFPDDGENVEEVMKNADVAMYHAKSEGRNNYQFFTPSMNQANLERLELENDIRAALEKEQFMLHFQPKIDADTLWVVGVEALVRWQHPTKGLIPPGQFIPLAEESGLMLPLGEWILRAACRQLGQWHRQGISGLQISVNLSQRQFRQANLCSMIASIVAQEGFDPKFLELEITESMVMENPAKTIESMRELRNIGIKLSLDDFGTGYASLNYLKQFPINCIKLDRSYVKDIATDPHDAAICAATISLANSLGLEVVAEGVETAKQYEYLKRLGCKKIQGYYFCKPLPEAEVIAYIESSHSKDHSQITASYLLNILIIDDDEFTCTFHKQLLENIGHRPIAVSNPTDGLALIRNNPPDFFNLIMLDMLMPEMSGVELIRRICQFDYKIPIAVVTSFKQDAARQALHELEQDYKLTYDIDYFIIEKPIIIDKLKELLRKLL